jgi:hypothetical protein
MHRREERCWVWSLRGPARQLVVSNPARSHGIRGAGRGGARAAVRGTSPGRGAERLWSEASSCDQQVRGIGAKSGAGSGVSGALHVSLDSERETRPGSTGPGARGEEARAAGRGHVPGRGSARFKAGTAGPLGPVREGQSIDEPQEQKI